MTVEHECPACHKDNRMKMIRTQKTVYDMDEHGYRNTADQGEVVFDEITECGCECGYTDDCKDFVKK